MLYLCIYIIVYYIYVIITNNNSQKFPEFDVLKLSIVQKKKNSVWVSSGYLFPLYLKLLRYY